MVCYICLYFAAGCVAEQIFSAVIFDRDAYIFPSESYKLFVCMLLAVFEVFFTQQTKYKWNKRIELNKWHRRIVANYAFLLLFAFHPVHMDWYTMVVIEFVEYTAGYSLKSAESFVNKKHMSGLFSLRHSKILNLWKTCRWGESFLISICLLW